MKKTFIIPSHDKLRSVMMDVWNHVNKSVEEINEKKGLKIIVQPESIRNIAQNNCMWAALTELSDQILWHGEKLSSEEYKDLLTAGLKKSKVIPNIEGNGFVIVGQRTSNMSVKEMSELIELIFAFGSEHGCKFKTNREY